MIPFFRWLLMAAILTLPFSSACKAENYPSRTIKLIVPYPAGGIVDAVGRILANKVSERIGQTIIVENKLGAGGRIGTRVASEAAPDGYTLLIQATPVVIWPSMFSNLGWDPIHSFTPVAYFGEVPSVIIVSSRTHAHSLADFVALAKKHPKSLAAGSAGVGTVTDLSLKILEHEAGISLMDVPYNGLPPALLGLYRNDIQVMAIAVNLARPGVTEGRIRPLAVTSKIRSSIFPDVPTVKESGYPHFEATSWYGLLAPHGTPPAIVDRLNKAFVDAIKDPAVHKALSGFGMEFPSDSDTSPAALGAIMARGEKTWADVVKQAGIQKQP